MTRPLKFDGQRPFVGQLCLTPFQWKHPIFAPGGDAGKCFCLGVQLKKHTELWTLLWKNVTKVAKKSKNMQQLFDDFVSF